MLSSEKPQLKRQCLTLMSIKAIVAMEEVPDEMILNWNQIVI